MSGGMHFPLLDRSREIGEYVPEADDGLVICRCEEITKGEIRRAVHEGMWTMTEVKRYLRAGMGLCQGKTCGRTVRGIIARELGMRPEEIPGVTERPPARPQTLQEISREESQVWE